MRDQNHAIWCDKEMVHYNAPLCQDTESQIKS